MAGSELDQPLRFDSETYSIQQADHLSEQMQQSYQRLSADTAIPIVAGELRSSVALIVSPTGRLVMRWNASSGKKSTHAVEAGFMLRSARKHYERGEAVKDLPLVRAIAHALPEGKQLDTHSGEEQQTAQRGKRTATQHFLDGLVVMDTTAGLGRDAAIALFAGAEVYAVDRNPAIYALLRFDIERRLNQETVARERLTRLHPVLGDSAEVLRAVASEGYTGPVPVPDVVLIDLWTDDNPHIDEFKDRQIARMLRHVDGTPTKRAATTTQTAPLHRDDSTAANQTAAIDEAERDSAQDAAELRSRKVHLQRREALLLAEARRAAKRCVVVKRLKSAASKSELLDAERHNGAVALHRGGMFEYVIYGARNEAWEAANAVAEAVAPVVTEGIDPVVDTSLDAAMAVAEQRRDA